MDADDFPTTESAMREGRQLSLEEMNQASQEAGDAFVANLARIEAAYAEHADEAFIGRSPERIATVTVGIDLRPRGVEFRHKELMRQFDRETVAEELTAAFRDARAQADERRREIAEAVTRA
ncbi:YbaB/EbfC family nucleoid-associated protein [Glycomyces buryatensis]|uniref:YbaB/EbfC family nucleoid-associated protein n=1 Tax=Glycomyces buryatensis TaxID=2570927 RepID=A0A4S8QJ84_9ACTN|nr:YbaB/EbfC family nucleoid-associated protein [Glycomyces buryatensis]THV41429.1 YbaB/EbfC family nucleoid-associated protein [Glycomyces buryatensis]